MKERTVPYHRPEEKVKRKEERRESTEKNVRKKTFPG